MSLAEIKSKILEEARVEAAALEQTAQAEAKKISEREHQAAQRESEAIVRQARHQAEAVRQAVGIEQDLAARKALLDLKQGLIGQAFIQAGQLLADLPAEAYQVFLKALLKSVPADYAPSGAGIPEERKALSQKILRETFAGLSGDRIKVQPGLAGGFYLVGKNYDLNLTWTRLVEELRSELTAPVGRLIFSEGK